MEDQWTLLTSVHQPVLGWQRGQPEVETVQSVLISQPPPRSTVVDCLVTQQSNEPQEVGL